MSRDRELADICTALAARAPELARTLLPRGHREGAEWREARSGAGGLGDSLSVHLDGPKAGIWQHGAACESGDALKLIGYLETGGDLGKAIAWARNFLGLDGRDPERRRRTREAVEAMAARDEDAEADAERRRKGALALYLAGRPELAGTPVAAYLAGRGLDLARLDFPVRALRYHERLWDPETARHWPGMVAAIHGPDGFLAVHRTFLWVRPGARVEKAPWPSEQARHKAKRCFGDYRGGAIRLWRGITIDPETGEVRQARRLAEVTAPVIVDLTEGIEDGLSVALALPAARVLVGVALANMAAIRWPAQVAGVRIWQQNDPPDSPAAAGFARVVEAIRAQGKRVWLARPPEGVKDVNELLMAGMAAA